MKHTSHLIECTNHPATGKTVDRPLQRADLFAIEAVSLVSTTVSRFDMDLSPTSIPFDPDLLDREGAGVLPSFAIHTGHGMRERTVVFMIDLKSEG